MKRLVIVGVLLGLTACNSTGDRADIVDLAEGQVACKDPRPMVCTMEYRPVCATLVAGGEKTYASGCNACADVAVTRYTPKACEAL